AQTKAMRNLLVPNRPPIWRRENLNRSQEDASLLWETSLSLFRNDVRTHPTIFVLHAIIILILAAIVRWLRRGLHKWTAEEPGLRRTAPVFDVPLSTATALSFLIAGPIYSQAPLLLQAILGGVLLIPTARIQRRLVDKALYPILDALLLFYFVDQLRLITAALPLLSRVILVAEMAGATLFLIWLIRSKHWSGEAHAASGFARLVRVVLRLGLVIFPATFLASVLGYVNLANLLGNGALKSAYVAAALYAALRIVEGLIIIALRVRPLALSRVVRLHRSLLQRRLCGIARFLAVLMWLSLTLKFFALQDSLMRYGGAALEAKLTIGFLNISLGQVLVFIVTVWTSLLVSRFVRFLLEEDVYHHWRVERGIPQAISTMVHYTVLLVGLFVALAVLGVDLTKITILAGAFTVGIGFGLQTVINNFVCGLILLFERPIKVGDVVQVDANIGEVQRIGIRACVIRTADGSEIILPNGTLISNKVKNWTFSDQYRAVEVQVSVARGVAPQRVVEILKHVAADHPGIVKEPPPQAYAVNFASGAVSFQLRAWTDRSGDWIQVRSDLSVAIDDALTQQDIAIAQPWDGAPTVADVHILGTPHPTGRIARALWDQPLQVPVKPDVIHGQLRSLLATLGFPVKGILL
ncbi:MAG TPA: mechanosensitive ion channel domain-containing protein, partial [Terrimicrobiaceae bacterium]|nr:mechanosensitive ion channel domain-containing protein [Terrimicrobiaceae bacterium]